MDLTTAEDPHLLTAQAAIANQIARLARGTLVLDEVLQVSANHLQDTLKVNGCLIFLADDFQPRVASQVSVAISQQRCTGVLVGNGGSPKTSAVNAELTERIYTGCADFYEYFHSWLYRGKSVILPRLDRQLLPVGDGVAEWGFGAILIVPLLYRESYLGGLMLYQCQQEREWTPQEIAFVEAIAAQCAIALTLTELEERDRTAAKNRVLLETIPDLIFRVTRDGIYLDWKAAREDTLLLPASEIIGKHLHQTLPHQVAGLIWEHVELACETNQIQIVEYQQWLDGKCHHFEVRIVKSGLDEATAIVQNISDRVQARVALAQVNDALEMRVEERTAALRETNHILRAEIVERKRVEEALRESEERFRQAVVNAPFPIMIHAEDGEVLQINQIWTELTGYTHDEIPTLADWIERAYADNKETAQASIPKLYDLNQRVDQGEFTVTTKNGENRIWNFSSAPLGRLSDGRRVIISVATDITERKQTELEVQFLHSVTQAIFESQDLHEALAVAIQKVCEATGWDFGEAWVPKADGSTLECSPAWYSKTKDLDRFRNASQTLTFSPGVGLPGRVWLSQKPEWRRDVSAESDKIYLRAQFAREVGLKAGLGIPVLTPKGILAVLVFYMFESQDEDQRLIDLISASTELGLMIQRKQAEGEIRKALVQERELTELKSRFISMTSHEFRTPLTTIQSSAELLEHYGHKWAEEKKLTHLHRIQTSVKHMTKLLEDVLIIGKADAGKLELNPAPLELENFCRTLVEELQLNDTNQHMINFTYSQGRWGEWESGRVGEWESERVGEWESGRVGEWESGRAGDGELCNNIPVSPFPCMDEKLLRQILENLLSNAIKYSPGGSTVEFTVRYFSDRAVFKICDRGIGIPLEDQQRLFETFHRATNVGTIAGTGLGLAIVKRCVDIHQGQIAVESQIGVGTTFTITLPLYNSVSTDEENFSD